MSDRLMSKQHHFYPVIIAGGSGTRFWPLSRSQRPKQTLALDGKQTMVQQAVARLAPLAPKSKFLVITGTEMAPVIRKQLKQLKTAQILAEPVSRNTAPAMGLAAHILLRKDPDALLGIFPADHTIANLKAFHQDIEHALQKAGQGANIVVCGIPPTRPETVYGYMETGSEVETGVFRIKRFTEKPDSATAEKFIASGNYLWNGGMFFWRAQTLVNALEEHLPETNAILAKIAATYGKPKFTSTYKKLYPKCQNISIDFAVMEPRSEKGEMHSDIFCVRANFGWSDLGTWNSLHQHRVFTGGAGSA